MANKARCAVLEAPERIGIRSFALPEIGADAGLLEVEMAGICHTDVGLYHGSVQYAPYPLILGHEILGRIAEIGPIAQKRWGVDKGDRVAVEAMVRCGFCQYCIEGDYKFCTGRIGYGTFVSAANPPHLWGSYSEYMYLAPGTLLHKIPPGMPAGTAILANVAIANAIQWTIFEGGMRFGDTVVVQGVGSIGLSCIAVAREAGARRVIATGLASDRKRLELARRFGADAAIDVEADEVVERVKELTDGAMADVVVDVTGSGQAVAKSIEVVRVKGTVVNAGVTGDATKTDLLLDRIMYKQIRFQGVFTNGHEAMKRAIAFAQKQKYPFEEIVTHKFPLAQAEEAVKTAGRELGSADPIKVTIVPHLDNDVAAKA